MPPQVYGDTGETRGEKLVYDCLHHLPDDCTVYSQPKLVHGADTRYPDFVIVHPRCGVVVLEVKDWVNLLGTTRTQVQLQDRDGTRWETSPVEQARKASYTLTNMLQDDPALRDYAGRLDLYYAYCGILPNLPPTTIQQLERQWGAGLVLGREDLAPDRIAGKIERTFGHGRNIMSDRQVRATRAIIDGRNRLVDSRTGEFKGVVDSVQESLYKEPLRAEPEPAAAGETRPQQTVLDLTPPSEVRVQRLEADMPAEAARLSTAQHVRLVRGHSGTGKTDVLILRAQYLHQHYPDLDILVTTFNDPLYRERLKPEIEALASGVDVIKCDTLCSQIYRKRHRGGWSAPQDTRGLIRSLLQDPRWNESPVIQELGGDFLADEIIWMKETGRTNRDRYLGESREGRGGVASRRLTRRVKEVLWDFFEAYQQELASLPAHDWVDLHEKVWQYLQEGVEPNKRYDVVLIDEAQHFAPTWIQIIKAFLKPGGTLFMCDDPSQSVYRFYSWRQKGVEVVGRTRWLRIPYRMTRQIYQAAYTLVADNPLALQLLGADGECVRPDIDSELLRDGEKPEAHTFGLWADEQALVVRKIGELVQKGVLLPEIGIVHDQAHVLKKYRQIVPEGVKVLEVKKQTGLEYKALFIPRINDLIGREVGIAANEDEARQRLKLYMAMTRPRTWLYLLAGPRWPSMLEPVRPYVEWFAH